MRLIGDWKNVPKQQFRHINHQVNKCVKENPTVRTDNASFVVDYTEYCVLKEYLLSNAAHQGHINGELRRERKLLSNGRSLVLVLLCNDILTKKLYLDSQIS